jgi:hypothetical protein
LAHDTDLAAARGFILQTYAYYAGLMQHGLMPNSPSGSAEAVAGAEMRAEPNLGGQLFWAGELDATGRALAVAGNIAGAATLTATGDVEAQRLAVRDGIVDFLVTSLDEALRVLKNEIRKRATVAVCVGSPIQAIEGEMAERGVRPDLLREGILRTAERFAKDRGQTVARFADQDGNPDPTSTAALVLWRAEAAPAQVLPRLDAIALQSLAPEDLVARRWVRSSGRYLGRLGHSGHLVWSTRTFATDFLARVRELTARGEIGVRGSIEVRYGKHRDQFSFGPPELGAS